ncbi:VWA containing CoxE family protein, partial [Mesorhizobium sp. M7A.F.Ca.US.011.01.1.1]
MSRDLNGTFSPFIPQRWQDRGGRHAMMRETSVPRAAAPLLGFGRLLRRYGFAVAPEQIS